MKNVNIYFAGSVTNGLIYQDKLLPKKDIFL